LDPRGPDLRGRAGRDPLGAQPQGDLVALLLHHGHRLRQGAGLGGRAARGPADDARPADLQRQREPVRVPHGHVDRPVALHPGHTLLGHRLGVLAAVPPALPADARSRPRARRGRRRGLRRAGRPALWRAPRRRRRDRPHHHRHIEEVQRGGALQRPQGGGAHRRRAVLPGEGVPGLRPRGLRLPRLAGPLHQHEQRQAGRVRLHR
jgi:hypothetical protein